MNSKEKQDFRELKKLVIDLEKKLQDLSDKIEKDKSNNTLQKEIIRHPVVFKGTVTNRLGKRIIN